MGNAEYMGSRQKSTVGSESNPPELLFLKMEAIKKKMQAMKVEKDNACDQADVSEEKMKAARIRAQKGEDEVEELLIKSRQLETELEITALTRRVSGLEEDLEKTEEKMVAAVAKLDKAGTAADDSERAKKVFQSKADEDEKRIIALEKDLKEAREKAEAADATYDEVAKKLATCESALEKAEERADVGETKILELEEELRVVANNLKSLEVAEEKANQREKTYKEQIKTLTAKLKQAEARAEFAEKSVLKLQKEVDRLEDELVSEQEKFKAITEELEQTFAEMSGY